MLSFPKIAFHGSKRLSRKPSRKPILSNRNQASRPTQKKSKNTHKNKYEFIRNNDLRFWVFSCSISIILPK